MFIQAQQLLNAQDIVLVDLLVDLSQLATLHFMSEEYFIC